MANLTPKKRNLTCGDPLLHIINESQIKNFKLCFLIEVI